MSSASGTALPPLDTGAAPLQRLRDLYERALLELLGESDTHDVTLVLSSRVATLLTHVLVPRGLDALKATRVAECVEITDDIAHVHCRNIVYLTLARVAEVRAVAMHARSLHAHAQAADANAATPPHTLSIFAAGKWTSMCDEVLEQFALHDRVHVGRFPMGFVPLDTDVLTLGDERCLFDCSATGDRSALVDVAVALHQVQEVYGQFAHIKYKGELSMLVLNHMVELSARAASDLAHQSVGSSTTKRSPMDALILLDRRVDYASALSTPLTYEALLDEILHIHDGFVSLSPLLLTADPTASDAPVPQALNSTDVVYAQIRSLHVHAVASVLNAQASALQTTFQTFQATSATASAADVHAFVQSVPRMQAAQQTLERHINLLEFVELTTNARAFRDQWRLERAIMDDESDGSNNPLDAIQELIFRHAPLANVLRLLCLYCVVHDGLPRAALERMKLHVVRTYGHELVFSFATLARLGLLYECQSDSSRSTTDTQSRFHAAAAALNVMDLDVDVANPTNTAFVTGGYAPISVRLVEEVLNAQSWRAVDAAMNCLHGPRAELSLAEEQQQSQHHQHHHHHISDATAPTAAHRKRASKKKRVVMVCFVGGVTHVEIAALRWLAPFYPYELLIAGTSVTNGTAMLTDVLERMHTTRYSNATASNQHCTEIG